MKSLSLQHKITALLGVMGLLLACFGCLTPLAYGAKQSQNTLTPEPRASQGVQTPTDKAPLAENGTMRVMVYPGVDGSSTAVLVQYAIPGSVELPARIRIPQPQGARVGWAGEISSETGLDNKLPYTSITDEAGTYVEFTLTKSRTGQVDFSGLPLTTKDGALHANVVWKQTAPAEKTLFEVRLPAEIHAVKITPQQEGSPDKNDYGETLYTLPTKTMKVGQSSTIDVSYKTGSGLGGTSLTSLLVIAAVILAVVAFVLITLAFKHTQKTEK